MSVDKTLAKLIHENMYDERGVVRFREYIFLDEAKSALKKDILELVPEKDSYMPFNSDVKRGYNQAIEEITKALEEYFK